MTRRVPVQGKQLSWYPIYPASIALARLADLPDVPVADLPNHRFTDSTFMTSAEPPRPRKSAPSAVPAASDEAAPLDASPARALGDFIRAHRERLSPQAVGLPPGPRRRTPGLRREEVAQLCGVSPTWYTWIEQGRPVSASSDALARIAVALQLSRAERAYLFELAGERDPAEPTPASNDAPAALIATVNLIDAPAYVLDRQWNALAWNRHAAELFVGWLDGAPDPARERNLLRFTFTEPAARTLIVDWETRARRLAAEFRADSIRHLNEGPTRALIDALTTESEAFGRFWASQDVGEREGGPRAFDHPLHGRVLYEQITLRPAHREDLLLVVLVRA